MCLKHLKLISQFLQTSNLPMPFAQSSLATSHPTLPTSFHALQLVIFVAGQWKGILEIHRFLCSDRAVRHGARAAWIHRSRRVFWSSVRCCLALLWFLGNYNNLLSTLIITPRFSGSLTDDASTHLLTFAQTGFQVSKSPHGHHIHVARPWRKTHRTATSLYK